MDKGVPGRQYGITTNRYKELKYFCMQHREKKVRSASDEQCRRDVELVEVSAREAAPGIAAYVIRNVTEGTPYEYMDVPCGRRQFYEARRKFFDILSGKK